MGCLGAVANKVLVKCAHVIRCKTRDRVTTHAGTAGGPVVTYISANPRSGYDHAIRATASTHVTLNSY